jgi:hypothetical protein
MSSALVVRDQDSRPPQESADQVLRFDSAVNPNGIIAKVTPNKRIPDTNDTSDMLRIVFPIRDTRDMPATTATLHQFSGGSFLIIEEPCLPKHVTETVRLVMVSLNISESPIPPRIKHGVSSHMP